MRRRDVLKGLVASPFGIGLASRHVTAACDLEAGTWYDGTVADVTDGDTMDVVLDCDGEEYEVRHLGFDTAETKRNSRYEEVREWEGIEDDNYLAEWGENAKDYAQNGFPDGTAVQIAIDEKEDTYDPFGRLLAYMRYDKSGDGSMDTVYNKDIIELGYARVYGSSLTKHDEYWQAEHNAQADGLRVWQQSDPENTSEVDNDAVSKIYFPNASSVRTSDGAIADSRVPVYAESTAYQDLDSGGIDYSDIPMVGVDESNNVALIGGLFINEANESDAEGQHAVFLSNLIDYLSSLTGTVLIEGGHRQFNAEYSLSNEDAVVYQRYLEGVGLPFEQVNSLDGVGDNALSNARGIIVTTPPNAFTSSEIDALATYASDGGAVILMGSALASGTARSNLDDIANGLGSDLRLNADQVYDDDNNTGSSAFITTTVFDTSFPLFDSYTPDSDTNSSPTCSIVNPSDGDTVSGTVTIQVDASDEEDDDTNLDVEVAIDGGTYQTASYNSTSGYYEYDWDTTGVDDGDHTIDARATDSDGATTDASQITVTVDNVESAPTIDSLTLSEVETSDSDAEFDADWQVSDDDGDLESVDLTLTDDTDGETEDTASIDVSGDSASGTTRLVAPGDEGSGNSYTVDLTVSDSAGNSASDSASATESEQSPTVDSLALSEVETSDSDAEFDADWQVSDGDGDLETVDLTLTDDTDGETEDTASIDVSGDSASGTTRLVAPGDDGSGNTYTVELTVSDSFGNTATDTASTKETEDTSSSPAIDKHDVTESGSPNPHANIDDDWAVSDADGDLDTVTIEVFDSGGTLVDSTSESVSGSEASGFDEFKIMFGDGATYDVTLTVTDTAGNAVSDTQTVTA